MIKASAGGGIPAELFKILKDDAVKGCTQYVSKFGKLSGHRTGKGHFSFQSQRREMPKNVHYCTTVLIAHASEVKVKIFQTRLQQYLN